MTATDKLRVFLAGREIRRVLLWLKIVVSLAGLFFVLSSIVCAPQFVWSGARLAPTFAILAGYHPYYPLDRGPILNTIYGPFTDIYYLPCGLFYHHVTLAIMAGSVLSFVAFLIPVLLLIRRTPDKNGGAGWWLVVLCLLQIIAYQGLSYSAFSIHADAPAVLFVALCILFLDNRKKPLSWRSFFLSAACGTAAAWTKQICAPILILPLAVAFFEQKSWRLRSAVSGWILILNILIFSIFAAWCGKDALLENIWRIPAAHPIAHANFLGVEHEHPVSSLAGKLQSVVVEMHVLIGKYLGPYILWLFTLIGVSAAFGRTLKISMHLSRLPLLFFAGAALCLPGSAAAVLKAGGFINSESPFIWLFTLGILTLLLERRKRDVPGAALDGSWTIQQIVYPVFTGIALIGLAGRAPQLLHENIGHIANPFDNEQEMAVKISIEHPRQVYFPWHPLAGLVGEGKLYHFYYGVLDRNLADKGPSSEHYFAGLPEKVEFIAWPTSLVFATNNMPPLQPTNAPFGISDRQFEWFTFKSKP